MNLEIAQLNEGRLYVVVVHYVIDICISGYQQ
jgi:hypothetical protein